MRKILCALSLFSFLSADAILTIDGYKQYISNFRSDVDLLKGYVLSDFENILEEQRLFGNFKSGIRGRHDGKGLSYQDQGNDAMTRLVIQLFPSVGGHLNAEGTGSFTNLIMQASEKFSEVDLIVGMFQLAQDVRSQRNQVDLKTDERIIKNFRDLITAGKNSFSKFSAEECLRYIDLLRSDSKIEKNKKEQIEKRIWKTIENQLKDVSVDWSLKCLKMLSGCKDEDIKANIRNKILKKAVPHYFGLIQDKNLFLELSKLVINIVESVDSENTSFEEKIDREKYPQNYTNYVISAYAWRILNNNQLKTLSEKLQQRLGYKGGDYTNESIGFLQKQLRCFPFGDGHIPDNGSAFFQDEFFMDCTENTLKLFFAMLLYSIDDNPADNRLPNTEIGEKIRKFFAGGREKIQEQALSNTNRSEWAAVVSDIPNITYLREKTGLKYEIDSGWEHIIEAICVLLEGYKAGNDDGSKIYKRKYKAQKTIEYINQRIKNSQNESHEYIKNNVGEVLNGILGIRTDIKLTAEQISDTVCNISASRWDGTGNTENSVTLNVTWAHSVFKNGKRQKEIPEITENEWIDSLLVNRHKATKNYHPVSKFTAARHKHLKQKIFLETLARRFYSNLSETKDLIKILGDYTEQEQIEILKLIYNHAQVHRFLELFYNPQGIIKQIFDKISVKELEGKTPAESLLRYYVSNSRESVAKSFDDILNKSIKTKDLQEVKSFFEMSEETAEKFMQCFSKFSPESIKNEYYTDLLTHLRDDIHVEHTIPHFIYANKMGEKYLKRYKKYFRDPDIREFDMQHEQWLFGGEEYAVPVLKAIDEFMEMTV